MKMIDPPQVPVAPVGPNRLRTITIGFLLSLVAGIGLVFVLEYLDNTVKTVEDIARYTQLPALSIIPAMTGRKSRMMSSGNGKKKDAEGLQMTSSNKLQTERLMALDGRSSIAEAPAADCVDRPGSARASSRSLRPTPPAAAPEACNRHALRSAAQDDPCPW